MQHFPHALCHVQYVINSVIEHPNHAVTSSTRKRREPFPFSLLSDFSHFSHANSLLIAHVKVFTRSNLISKYLIFSGFFFFSIKLPAFVQICLLVQNLQCIILFKISTYALTSCRDWPGEWRWEYSWVWTLLSHFCHFSNEQEYNAMSFYKRMSKNAHTLSPYLRLDIMFYYLFSRTTQIIKTSKSPFFQTYLK